MEEPIWQNEMKKIFYWDEIWYSEVFGVTDYESYCKIHKSKMADSMWWIEVQKSVYHDEV